MFNTTHAHLRVGAIAFLLVGLASPLASDASWIAFLSERGLFSIDLFIADATTGTVTRQVTRTAAAKHGSGWNENPLRVVQVEHSGRLEPVVHLRRTGTERQLQAHVNLRAHRHVVRSGLRRRRNHPAQGTPIALPQRVEPVLRLVVVRRRHRPSRRSRTRR